MIFVRVVVSIGKVQVTGDKRFGEQVRFDDVAVQ